MACMFSAARKIGYCPLLKKKKLFGSPIDRYITVAYVVYAGLLKLSWQNYKCSCFTSIMFGQRAASLHDTNCK